MSDPDWFFISVVETPDPEELATKFNEFCHLQNGVLNHGWRMVTLRPRRYMFQFVSQERICSETIYYLSMLLQNDNKVISEATNSISDVELHHTIVYLIDTRHLTDPDSVLLSLEQVIGSNWLATYIEGFLTIRFSVCNISAVTRLQHELDHTLQAKGLMNLAIFKNWKE